MSRDRGRAGKRRPTPGRLVLEDGFLKAALATGFRLPERRHGLLSIGTLRDKTRFLPSARLLSTLGFTLYATRNTSRFLEDNGVPNVRLYKIHERRRPSLLEYISPERLDLIINIPAGYDRQELTDGYIIRRRAIDFGIPLITNLQLAELFSWWSRTTGTSRRPPRWRWAERRAPPRSRPAGGRRPGRTRFDRIGAGAGRGRRPRSRRARCDDAGGTRSGSEVRRSWPAPRPDR